MNCQQEGSGHPCAGHEAGGVSVFHLDSIANGRTRHLQKSQRSQEQARRVDLLRVEQAGRISAWYCGSWRAGRSREKGSIADIRQAAASGGGSEQRQNKQKIETFTGG